jgi:hypothetical protein
VTVTVDTNGATVWVGSSSVTVVKVSVEVEALVTKEVMIQLLPRAEGLVEVVVEEEFTNRPEKCE